MYHLESFKMKGKKFYKYALISFLCPLTIILSSQVGADDYQLRKPDEVAVSEGQGNSECLTECNVTKTNLSQDYSLIEKKTDHPETKTDLDEKISAPIKSNTNNDQSNGSFYNNSETNHSLQTEQVFRQYEIEMDEKTKEVNQDLLATLPKVKTGASQTAQSSKVTVQIPENLSYHLNKLIGVKHISEIAELKLSIDEKKALLDIIHSSEKHSKMYQNDGRGVVIATIDSGVDINSRDMHIDQNPDVKKHLKIKPNTELGFTEKVPFGFNYITGTYDLKDDSNRPHGMHIAGILAGNSGTVGGFKGIAPNAQLLAYRVFSTGPRDKDHPNYVGPDSTYHAIDDAIRRKADIISLSIGKRASGQNEDVFYDAVKKATDAGLIVVAAMGNYAGAASTNSYDTYVDNEYNLKDTAAAVGVAAIRRAIGVGSMNNLVVPLPRVAIDGIEYPYTEVGAHSMTRLPKLKQEMEMIFLGKGTEEDIAKYNPNKVDLKNKVVVIQRGDESVKTKVKRFLKNTKGIILVNEVVSSTRGNYQKAPVMGYDDLDLGQNWIISLSHNDGQALISKIKNLNDSKLSVSFDTSVKPYLIADSNGVSGFSSWGPNFSLEMKPDVLGRGEYIYSTRNNDDYYLSSGTSMAAPHVAASAALLLPKVKEWVKSNPELMSRFQLTNVDIMKILLMNTATPLINHQSEIKSEEVEYSPRQQGAGFINVEKAFKSQVLIRNGLSGGASLGEIGKEHTFTLTLHNLSEQRQTFDLNFGDLYTTTTRVINRDDEYGSVKIKAVIPQKLSNISFSGPKQISLAAKGNMEITFKLQSPDIINDFVEGFIYFKSKDKSHPDLSVPIMGFMGDWNKETILDFPAWHEDSKTQLIELVREKYLEHDKSDYEPLIKPEKGKKIDPQNYAMTTNLNRKVGPRIAFLRDASDYDVAIVKGDQKNQVVRVLKVGHYPFKYMESPYREDSDMKKTFNNPDPVTLWDGKVHDPASFGQLKKADPGQYYFRIRAKAGKNDDFESIYLPILIDNEKPKVNITLKNKVLGIDATDNHGIESITVSVKTGYIYQKLKMTKSVKGIFEVKLPENQEELSTYRIEALDFAGNSCEKTITINKENKITSEEENDASLYTYPKKTSTKQLDEDSDSHQLQLGNVRHQSDDEKDAESMSDWDEEEDDIDDDNILLTHGKEITLHALTNLHEDRLSYDDASKTAQLDYAIYLKKGYSARVRNINTYYNSLMENLENPYQPIYEKTLINNRKDLEYESDKIESKLTLANGNNLVYVEIFDDKGQLKYRKNYFIFVDLENPTLELLNKEVFDAKDMAINAVKQESVVPKEHTYDDGEYDDEDDTRKSENIDSSYFKGYLKSKDQNLTLQLAVKDNLDRWRLYINNDMVDSFDLDGYYQKNRKIVTYSMKVKDGQKIAIRLEDKYGNETEHYYIVKIDPNHQEKVVIPQTKVEAVASSNWIKQKNILKIPESITISKGENLKLNDFLKIPADVSYSLDKQLDVTTIGDYLLEMTIYRGNSYSESRIKYHVIPKVEEEVHNIVEIKEEKSPSQEMRTTIPINTSEPFILLKSLPTNVDSKELICDQNSHNNNKLENDKQNHFPRDHFKVIQDMTNEQLPNTNDRKESIFKISLALLLPFFNFLYNKLKQKN
ncbi:C5a peptidase [Streptococcus penaeicida]